MEPLIVPGNLDSLSSIGTYVLQAAELANLDKKVAYRLRLAVDELATNSIIYGYEENGIEGQIEIQATIDDQALAIVVEDTAPPFDPTMQAKPDNLDIALEQRRIGGLGIYLALTGVDAFTHEYTGTRNRNTLIIYRSSNPTAEGTPVRP